MEGTYHKNFILLNEGLRAYIQENMHSKERSKMEKEGGGKIFVN